MSGVMDKLLAGSAVVALVLSIFNAFSDVGLAKEANDIDARNTYIQENIGFVKINNQLINATASMAASNGDEALREMLSSEGVTFSVGSEQ